MIIRGVSLGKVKAVVSWIEPRNLMIAITLLMFELHKKSLCLLTHQGFNT